MQDVKVVDSPGSEKGIRHSRDLHDMEESSSEVSQPSAADTTPHTLFGTDKLAVYGAPLGPPYIQEAARYTSVHVII